MKTQSFEMFLHGKGDPQVITARLDETLREVLAKLDALPGDGQHVFIGEVDEAAQEPDADSDVHEPANLDLTLEQLGLQDHKHIHTRVVHRVEVTVYFNGIHHARRFSPATTIASVTAWAKTRFKIDPTGGADLVLALRPSGKQPRPDTHLGELLEPGSHALAFDLVREVTPQGARA
jgi:hypothetical protein